MKSKIENALTYVMGVVLSVALIAWFAVITVAPFVLFKMAINYLF